MSRTPASSRRSISGLSLATELRPMPPLAGMYLLCSRKLCSGSLPMAMPMTIVSNFDMR